MELNQYQERAMETCMETSENYSYMMGNLIAEVGEFAGKVAKAQRHGKLKFTNDGHILIYTCNTAEDGLELEQGLMKEAGDILWQLSGLCAVMGWDLETIARVNLDKLASRKKRGVIDGSGDER